MILPIIAMLAVTMIVAGYNNRNEEIEVREGTNEMKVKVPPYSEQKIVEESVSATSYINNENNSIELDVEALFWKGDFGDIRVSVKSNLHSDFDPSDLVIEARIIESEEMGDGSTSFHLLPEEEDLNNLTLWSHSEFEENVGFDIEESNFSINGKNLSIWVLVPGAPLTYEEDEGLNSSMTVEIRALVQVLSEDIETSVQITYVPEGGDVS